MKKIELIQSLLIDLDNLPIGDEHKLDALQKRADMVIRKSFGESSKYLKDLNHISFFPMVYPTDDQHRRQRWVSGQNKMLNLFKTMIEEIKLFDTVDTSENKTLKVTSKKKVFIVHGHDEEMKQAVARAVEKLELEAVILHEKSNEGRSIIQKLEDLSKVSFVIVLLSGDDMAYEKTNKPETARPRARQNVVFELGYFIGSLDRKHVMALFREDKDFEIPTDYSGIIFEPYDPSGKWKFTLVRELKSCGFSVDANKLI